MRHRQLAVTFAVSSANLVGALVLGIVTARAMSVPDRGVLLGTVLWSSFIAFTSVAGLDDAIIAFGEGQGATANSVRLVSRGRARQFVILGSLVIIPADGIILRSTKMPIVVAVMVCSILVIGATSYSLRRVAVIRSAGLIGSWNIVRLVPTTSYAFGVIVSAAVGRLTILTGIASFAMGGLLTCLVANLVKVPDPSPEIVSSLQTRQRPINRYGAGVMFSKLPEFANLRLDQIVLSVFLPLRELSLYATAVSLSSVLLIVGASIQLYLFPILASVGETERRKSTIKWLVLAIAFSLAGALTLGAMAPVLLRVVYGPGYSSSLASSRILLAGAVALTGLAVVSAYLKASRRVAVLVRTQLLGFVATIVLLPVMLAALGIEGAAIASTVAYFVTFSVAMWQSQLVDGKGSN